MKLALLLLELWKLSSFRIEIKTSIGRFREKGGYIMKEEMQKKLFCKIVLVTFFVAECTFKANQFLLAELVYNYPVESQSVTNIL